MGTDKYAFQPIREVISAIAVVAVSCAWGAYCLHASRDLVAGLFETALILIIAAEAYARD